MFKRFEEHVKQLCDQKKMAGVVCMAADRKGVLYEKAFGVRDLATGEPMTSDTVFAIASMTKPIVASACMQLVEQGLIGLDQDIGEILPDFRHPLVLDGFDKQDVPILRRTKTPITLRHIMAQTSGISDSLWDSKRKKWCERFSIPGLGPTARRVPLAFDPGTGWAYGIGTDLGMECLQAVTGQTLEQYLQEHLFGPLQMKSTSFHLSKQMEQRLAAVHLRDENGFCQSNTTLQQPLPAYGKWYDYGEGEGEGHGGLYSTAQDYLRFLQAILGNGSANGCRILEDSTVRLMGTNQIGSNYIHWPNSVPDFDCDMNVLLDGIHRSKWGLGWMLNDTVTNTGRAPGSMSWFGGYDTHMWVDHESNLCGVVMLQTRPAANADSLSVVYQFEKALHGLL